LEHPIFFTPLEEFAKENIRYPAKVALIANEMEILNILSQYPTYFENLYKRMIG